MAKCQGRLSFLEAQTGMRLLKGIIELLHCYFFLCKTNCLHLGTWHQPMFGLQLRKASDFTYIRP